MLPEFSGKAGDFLAHGRGQGCGGSAAGFTVRLGLVLALGICSDLGVKFGEARTSPL
jgi:hypothetical protein